VRANETNGEQPTAPRHSLLKAAVFLSLCTILLTRGVAVATAHGEFEIVVPIETVVFAPKDSVTVLRTTPTPEGLEGQTCAVVARAINQSSVHPGNDLAVESLTTTLLSDVEGESGGTVTATDTMVLDNQILIHLVMGPDEVFSAGIEVLFDCPPEETTTTAPPVPTTSTFPPSSTTTPVDTTTIPEATTTTIVATTITEGPTTTTVPSDTTTTIPDEVLVYTGPPDESLLLLAIAATASGVLLLVGERSTVLSRIGVLAGYGRRCKECQREALFLTPHGRLCMTHTRRALDDDTELWLPKKLKPRHWH